MLALSAGAATVRFSFTNYLGQPDTNWFMVIPIGDVAQSDGSFITRGPGVRITPNAYGQATNNFEVGNYLVTNRFLNRGFVIRVPNDHGPTVYCATCATNNTPHGTGLAISGFNTFVTIHYGTNPPPTYDEITNSLGYLPAAAVVAGVGTSVTTNGNRYAVNVIGSGGAATNVIDVASGDLAIEIVTNGLLRTFALSDGSIGTNKMDANALTLLTNNAGGGGGNSSTNVFPEVYSGSKRMRNGNLWYWFASLNEPPCMKLFISVDGINWSAATTNVCDYQDPDFRTNNTSGPYNREVTVQYDEGLDKFFGVYNYDPYNTNANAQALGIIRSDDGTNWTRIALIWPNGITNGGGQTFAATWFTDSDGSNYLSYPHWDNASGSFGTFRQYTIRRLDNTYTNWSAPVVTVDPFGASGGGYVWDGFIVKSNNVYETWAYASVGIDIYTNTTGPQSLFYYHSSLWNEIDGAAEGPMLFKFSPLYWRLYSRHPAGAKYIESLDGGRTWSRREVATYDDGVFSGWHAPGMLPPHNPLLSAAVMSPAIIRADTWGRYQKPTNTPSENLFLKSAGSVYTKWQALTNESLHGKTTIDFHNGALVLTNPLTSYSYVLKKSLDNSELSMQRIDDFESVEMLKFDSGGDKFILGHYWHYIGNGSGLTNLPLSAVTGLTNSLAWLTNNAGKQFQSLASIPTNSIPASSSGITNYVLLNLTNVGPAFVATNPASAGSFITNRIVLSNDPIPVTNFFPLIPGYTLASGQFIQDAAAANTRAFAAYNIYYPPVNTAGPFVHSVQVPFPFRTNRVNIVLASTNSNPSGRNFQFQYQGLASNGSPQTNQWLLTHSAGGGGNNEIRTFRLSTNVYASATANTLSHIVLTWVPTMSVASVATNVVGIIGVEMEFYP